MLPLVCVRGTCEHTYEVSLTPAPVLLFLRMTGREPAFQLCSPCALDATTKQNTPLQPLDKTLTGLQVKSQLLQYTPFFNDGVMLFEGITRRIIIMKPGTSTSTLLAVQV